MALLQEYAITPGVFASDSYDSVEVANLRVQAMRDVLFQEGVVRNLCNGEWTRALQEPGRTWVAKKNEILKKLRKQNRLMRCSLCPDVIPRNDQDWGRAAMESHGDRRLDGVIATTSSASELDSDLVCSVERLSIARWWTPDASSMRPVRTLEAYIIALSTIFRASNSLMFIDPHLNPQRLGYRSFPDLVCCEACRASCPKIELHRVCYTTSQNKQDQNDLAGWKSLFSGWERLFLDAGIKVEVFIWDDFHDRYLISNLLGVTMPNGFDVTSNPNEQTTWTRMGREAADDVQREFDPSANRHRCIHRFEVGAV